MKIVTSGPGQGNTDRATYVVGDRSEVIVIDPAFDAAAVFDAVDGREIMAVILTSGSETHLAGVLEVVTASGEWAPIALHRADLPLWNGYFGALAASPSGRHEARALRSVEPNTALVHGGAFEVGGMRLETMHLPGQTPGSVALICDDLGLAFTGESLYMRPLGDLFDAGKQHDSMRSFLRAIPPKWLVLPGIGVATTAEELRPPYRWG